MHLTFQHFPARYSIFKDTRVNIYFMRMTAGESYNISHKSEHEICNYLTNQLAYMFKREEIERRMKEEVSHGSGKSNYKSQNQIGGQGS